MCERDVFLSNNMGLVHSCCKHFLGKGIEYDDIFQAGCIGLIKAYDGFDASLGFCFSTYAVPVILGEIKRMFRDGGSIKVSRGIKELSLKIKNECEKAIKRGEGEPSVSTLAESLSVSPEEITEAICATQPTVSLTYESDDEIHELDLAVSDNGDMLTDRLMLDDVLSRLPKNDSLLIKLRYFEGKTQQETASVLSMTQVQVSRSEKKILGQLRQMLCE
ncbi:MAG: sigma-70 family RNA polymerase sigma factor [Ruminococcaceae bacterium]|nr:sigma-70 family RNA polymerase sigma factor [Oscillospiraceae bacterium]